MASFDEIQKSASRQQSQGLGEQVQYDPQGAESISTWAIVSASLGFIGDESQLGEDRYAISLLVEDCETPMRKIRRGDKIINAAGVVWDLQEKVDADEWVMLWTATVAT